MEDRDTWRPVREGGGVGCVTIVTRRLRREGSQLKSMVIIVQDTLLSQRVIKCPVLGQGLGLA